jgi:Na+-driven multidrug efflux pump
MKVTSYTSTSTFGGLAEWRGETAAIVGLAAPIALTMLSHIAMVTTDVVMMGWLGAQSLAAGALANHYYWLFDMGAMGLLARSRRSWPSTSEPDVSVWCAGPSGKGFGSH